MTRAERQKGWEARITGFLASGQSATTWCAANDVKPHQLWYWVRRHKTQHDAPSAKSPEWLAVEVDDHVASSALLIKVGQASIEVEPGFDPALLAAVVRTLATLC